MQKNHIAVIGRLGIVLGLAIMGSAAAYGTVQVDLRFADGSKTQVAAPGDFAIDVWVAVVGTDPAKRDGLVWIYGSAQSAQLSGGAVLGAAGTGIISNAAPPGGAFTLVNPPGQPGTPQDMTHDGIQDWGTTSTLSAMTISYSSTLADPRAPEAPGTAPVYGDTPGVIAHTIANGTEYKVGTLTFHINQVNYGALAGGGVTQINWAMPQGTYIRWQGSFPDEVYQPYTISNSQYLPSLAGVNSVEFTAAQPAAGYSYATASGSPRIANLQLPDAAGSTFDLYAPADEVVTGPAAPGLTAAGSDDGVQALASSGEDWVLVASGVTAGSLYTLPYPVSALQVLGISPAAGIDPNDTSAFPVDFFYEGGVAGSVTRVAIVPEPASLALLGLAGMALLRRKR